MAQSLDGNFSALAVMPFDWTAMQTSILTWIRDSVPPGWSAIFSEQDAAPPVTPYVRVNCIVPPVVVGRADDDILQTGLALIVTDDIDLGNPVEFTLNGEEFSVPTNADDTLDEVADAIADEITASDADAEAFRIIGVEGGIYVVETVDGGGLVFVDLPDGLAIRAVEAVTSHAVATWSVECFGRPRDPVAGTPAFLESIPVSMRLVQSLETHDALDALASAGWSFVSVEGIRRTPQVAGSRWEDRSGFDVRLACLVRALSLGHYLDHLGDGAISGTVSGSLGSDIEVTIE